MPDAQRVVFGQTMVELAHRFDDFLLLDGDLANSTRADILAEAVPDRFIELGIAEQNLVGVAAGLATVGYRPWLSSFAVFLVNRDLDQVRMLVAQNRLPVRLAGAYSGLWTGYTGKTHQCVEDLAVMRAMPSMTVLAPADAPEARLALRFAHEVDGPVYVRLCRDSVPDVTAPDAAYDPTVGVWLRRGDDATLVSTGVQTTRVLEAASRLGRAGLEVGVLHVRALKPLPLRDLLEAARLGPIVTVEEHSVLGGLGGAVAEAVSETVPTRILRIGLADVFGASGDNDGLLRRFGLDAASVAERSAAFLSAS
jgi:transketolase